MSHVTVTFVFRVICVVNSRKKYFCVSCLLYYVFKLMTVGSDITDKGTVIACCHKRSVMAFAMFKIVQYKLCFFCFV